MTQRSSTQQGVAWTEKPGTWIALAVAFLAISMPLWVNALSGEKLLSFLAAVAFTIAAFLFAVYARRCARRRPER